MKKQVAEETIMEIKAALCSLNVRREYTKENVCVSKDMETIKYRLLLILVKMDSSDCD
jgi:hypothetical protein